MYNLIVRPLRSHAVARLLALCGAVVQRHVPSPVQRMGAQTWQRVLTRFPKFGDLVALWHVTASDARSPSSTDAAATQVEGEPHSIGSAGIARTPTTGAPDPAPFLATLTDHGTPWADRVAAADALARFESVAVLAALTAALHDPSAEVAARAALAIAQHSDVAAIDALRATLLDTTAQLNPITRAAAVAGLARRLGHDALGPVLDAVRDQDAEVSIAAIGAIAEHAPRQLENAVLPVLRDRSGYFLPLVRQAAAHAFERAATLSVAAATELARVEPDDAVRAILQRIADGGTQVAHPG